MTGTKRGVVSVVALVWATTLGSAQAQDEMNLADATAALNSGNQGKVEIGIQSLGLLGDTAAVEALATRVRRGLPRDLLQTAILALGTMGDPAAGPVLIELTRHRSSLIRTSATEMVAVLQPPDAIPALIAALHDQDADVRAAAAVGLGDMRASEALDTLFKAHERGVSEAAIAIGKAVAAADVPRVLAYVGHLPMPTLGPVLSLIIGRADLDENARLQVVARLSDLATREVKAFLGEVLATHGATLPVPLRTAITTAAQQIAD